MPPRRRKTRPNPGTITSIGQIDGSQALPADILNPAVPRDLDCVLLSLCSAPDCADEGCRLREAGWPE